MTLTLRETIGVDTCTLKQYNVQNNMMSGC